MPRKSQFAIGFERLLNDKNASPLNNPDAFKAILSASGLSATETIKHLGKGGRRSAKEEEEAKQKARLEILEKNQSS
jgi:hypothetical protein